ncbi:uncharacterized protein LOC128985640 isoform X2 [Macrosteles quadrilineatus]|uniref:uncharacterized protein LOC128985640 isoform X2 n=1 Tax=Macrosteles quadrilineatus TaxID=74068 RepID=UPI0023E2316F|nr:uncharacterized protein LOC128985640 isoform X2 [Macrosteles quadrilineatus]
MMEDSIEIEIFKGSFINEADKTMKLIESLKIKVHDLLKKGDQIAEPELKQTVIKQNIAELVRLTKELDSINAVLKTVTVDCPSFAIPYFVPDDNKVHRLMFLSGDNPWNFWLIDKSIDVKHILKGLMKKFQSGLLDPVDNPQTEQSVCFIDRNKAIRGIILQVKNENRIKLLDCDSNVTKVVTSDKLYKLDEDACSVHATALRCTITEDTDAIELWKNSDLRDIFCNTLREATLEVKILKRVSGSFPTFVVDTELKNEEEDTANLTEWISDRLMPELKKLDYDKEAYDNEALCDFLSDESLSPYTKRIDNKETNQELPLPLPVSAKDNQIPLQLEIENKEINNLNFPNTKFSDKMVTNLDNVKKENEEPKHSQITNDSQIKDSVNVVKSTPSSISSEESNSNNSFNRTESVSDARLNCSSEVFCPKSKTPDIPRFRKKYQNTDNVSQHNHTIATFVPPLLPWSSPTVNPPSWPVTEVNIMAPVFVPRNSSFQPNNQNSVQLPTEYVTLRKQATLLNENEIFKVLISHIENPSEFYVHFVNKNNKHLDKLLEDMCKYYSTQEKLEFSSWQEARSKLGQFCVCQWPDDNKWYRVEVLEWCTESNLVKVWFVDYGNTDSVLFTCLQPLLKIFGKLSICSQECHLAKVHPLIKGQPWSKDAIDYFKSIVQVTTNAHLYSIKVVESHDNNRKNKSSLSVVLFDDGPVTINDALVARGYAWTKKKSADSVSSNSSDLFQSTEDVSTITPSEPNPLLENFNEWDPMKEDFESVRNNPAINMEDACVAVSGYSAKDEQRICKFYARRGFCHKKFCTREHTKPNPDGVTTDKIEMYNAESFPQINLPKAGEIVKLKITQIETITTFYAQLEESKGISLEDEFEEDPETLTSLVNTINNPQNVMFYKKLALLPPPIGEMVLAKEPSTRLWHRARVTSEEEGIPECEVMFVDYGTTAIVQHQHLRSMENRFIHLPFQAVECCLANVNPLNNHSTEEGVAMLREILINQVVTARIYQSQEENNQLQVLVLLNNGKDLGNYLVEKNYCLPVW